MGDDVIRRRAIVHGRVQGVFFRDTVRERARTHGVAGSMRNRRDGAVEAVFEGPKESVERLLRFCEVGPPRAAVQRVEVQEEPPEGLRGFTIA